MTSDTLCGAINYELLFDSTIIDQTSIPISYDAQARTLKIYSEDSALVGLHSLMLSAYFADYPDVKTGILSYLEIMPAHSTLPPDVVYRPDWLSELQDQFIEIGEGRLEYQFGDRSDETRLEDSYV